LAVVLPTVSITAPDPNAAEAGPNTGTFEICRTGSTATSLSVHYVVSGTATPSNDYTPLTSPATFAAGNACVNLTLTPVDDNIVEPVETVVLNLSSGVSYTIGQPASATVAITSDDSVVVPPSTTSQPIPTLSEWALILLSGMLGLSVARFFPPAKKV